MIHHKATVRPRAQAQVDEGSTMLPDLVCLSHLRWDFVFQRPQHLMGRFARERRVFFVEEPWFRDGPVHLDVIEAAPNLTRVIAHLPWSLWHDADRAQRELLDPFFAERGVERPVLWFYNPVAAGFMRHVQPSAVVYDCMDELSAFRNPHPSLLEREAELLRRADLVFTGGRSLYEAKRGRHPSVHLFPSSIDAAHFGRARETQQEPAAQADLPRPRLGFFGVVDERMDLDLLAAVADARPEWQIVIVGPVVKIEMADLPRRPNLHFTGGATYDELPAWIAGWDVALIPFALNESTRFISPTKTPEYLAAGRPVVSTPITDVVRPYGENGLVRIASTADEFIRSVEAALAETDDERAAWLRRVDAFLEGTSWDRTWAAMADKVAEVVARSGGYEGVTGAAASI
ncbi:MAG TPA: glycosyltransferase family 1 protein [Longimicrobiaceae bacterium]|jgi:UDP-galactopyranose mutase|nr:glycosyltransferase family 1 protein [Longimicrobiaceae bacterium]